jgi:CP family cyanate transporter-like MFS transporter
MMADAKPGLRLSRRALGVAAVLLLAFNLRVAVSSVPPVLTDLGLGTVGQSLLVTVPVLCFGLAALAGPGLRRLVGEEQLLLVLVGALALGLLVRALWPSWGLFPGTAAAGLAISLMNVLVPAVVRGKFADHAAAMTAAYTVSLSVGASLAAGLTVPIRDATGSLHLALGVWALPAVLALVVWLSQVSHWRLTAAQRTLAQGQDGSPKVPMWTSRVAWLVTAFFGGGAIVYYAMVSWLPAIYQAKGDSAAAAGGLLAVFSTVGIIGNLGGPVLASRIRDHRVAVMAGVLAAATGVVGILASPPGSALLWVCLAGVGTGASFSLALLFIVERSPNTVTAVRLSAMTQAAGYAIAVTGLLALGLVRALIGSWTIPLILVLGVLGLELLVGVGAGRRTLLGAAGPRAAP